MKLLWTRYSKRFFRIYYHPSFLYTTIFKIRHSQRKRFSNFQEIPWSNCGFLVIHDIILYLSTRDPDSGPTKKVRCVTRVLYMLWNIMVIFPYIMSVFYDCILPVHSRSNQVNNENKITQPSARMSGISEDRTVTQTYVIRRRPGQRTGGCPDTFTAWASNRCTITTDLVPRSNAIIIIILWYTRNLSCNVYYIDGNKLILT